MVKLKPSSLVAQPNVETLQLFFVAAVPMANLAFSTRIPEILIDNVKVELIK